MADLEDYDEDCYPAIADSEGESEHTSLLMEHQQKEDSPEDFTCSVCAQVLLDPQSLHCGHSFCQLCLASVWASKGKSSPNILQCPVCRLPWRNFPGINIVLRNCINSSHGEVIAERRSNLTTTDMKLLDEFNSAKNQSWQSERREGQPRLGAQEIRALVMGCGVLILCFVVFLISLIALGIWVGSGSGGAFMRKPVSKWTNKDVLGWLDGLGKWPKEQNISRIFQSEGITGRRLVLLDKDDLESIGIRNAYRQGALLQPIEELMSDELSPKDLIQFKSAHRKLSLMLVVLYKLWPRYTFAYIFVFAYDGIFIPVLENFFQLTPSNEKETYSNDSIEWSYFVVFLLQVLLIPHFVVGSFAWAWWSVNSWLATAVMVHCFRATVDEVKAVVMVGLSLNNWKVLVARLPMESIVSFIKFLTAVLAFTLLWPITPHFLCDILFYLVIWESIFVLFLLPLLKLLWRNCNFRFRFGVERHVN